MKLKILLIMAIMMLPLVSAQWIQPLDCTDLGNDKFSPSRVFYDPADICFYGSGFEEGTATVVLEEFGEAAYSKEMSISNGILSSHVENGDTFFSGVLSGEYVLKVLVGEDTVQYDGTIYVGDTEVPEFSMFGIITIIVIGGMFVALRRSK